jgi:hypothetical protein
MLEIYVRDRVGFRSYIEKNQKSFEIFKKLKLLKGRLEEPNHLDSALKDYRYSTNFFGKH